MSIYSSNKFHMGALHDLDFCFERKDEMLTLKFLVVFNDYGGLPGSELVRMYGYITPHHERFDVVELSFKEITSIAWTYRDLTTKERLERVRATTLDLYPG